MFSRTFLHFTNISQVRACLKTTIKQYWRIQELWLNLTTSNAFKSWHDWPLSAQVWNLLSCPNQSILTETLNHTCPLTIKIKKHQLNAWMIIWLLMLHWLFGFYFAVKDSLSRSRALQQGGCLCRYLSSQFVKRSLTHIQLCLSKIKSKSKEGY